jgi:bifunctional non-homologous end joining protein LigD
VATPLAWREVTPELDLSGLTLKTVPDRLRRLKVDPWEGFAGARRGLPALQQRPEKPTAAGRPARKATIVTAKAPRRSG